MLRAKRKLTGEIVEAYFANKSQAPFLCPDCGDVVLFKTGRTKVNYFAHINPLACKFGAGESEAHENCKMEIFEALQRQPGVRNVALERSLGTNRPDVSAYINGVPVAIEVQISSLSLETITRRTIEYARKGIYVLWLLQPVLHLSNLSGRISERGRVSEHLQESPRLLARPLPPKSWDVSRREGVSSRRGFRGRRRTSPNGVESSQVFGGAPFSAQPVPTRLNPSGVGGGYAPAPTRSTRPKS